MFWVLSILTFPLVGPGLYYWIHLSASTMPDLVVILTSNKRIFIFDLTVSYERNISKNYNYKCHKYAKCSLTLIIVVLKLNSLQWRLDVDYLYLRIILKDYIHFTIPSHFHFHATNFRHLKKKNFAKQ